PIAGPETSVCQHPVFPHEQGLPDKSTIICPISPAISFFPCTNFPSTTTPAPTPKPKLIVTIELVSTYLPNQNSPKASARTSLSTTTGIPKACSKHSFRGKSRKFISGA